jgi:hypothetical protein
MIRDGRTLPQPEQPQVSESAKAPLEEVMFQYILQAYEKNIAAEAPFERKHIQPFALLAGDA